MELVGVYRYGFNGKENDGEVKGEGNQRDYGMRVYDPRIGRFLSVDPISKSYPELTPYQFGGNSPIANIDLDGLEPFPTIKQLYSYDNGAEIKVVAAVELKIKIINLSADQSIDMNLLRGRLETSLEKVLTGSTTYDFSAPFTTEKMAEGVAKIKASSSIVSNKVTFDVNTDADVRVVKKV